MGRALRRSRGSKHYDKPAQSHAELRGRLQDRGLIIAEDARVERYLRSLGYYLVAVHDPLPGARI